MEIYLDNAATTPLAPEILAGLTEHQRIHYANPGSGHPPGRAAKRLLEDARADLADLIGAAPDQITFTSGGTEALALAILGLAGRQPARIALSAVEHPAVQAAARRLVDHHGWQLDLLPVDAHARIRPEALEILNPTHRLVAIMLANNEVGTLNDLAALSPRIRARAPRARILTDAVQALGKIPLDVTRLGVDALAVGAHKLHGPKGIGALYCRLPLEPLFAGGGQEGGRRGGTPSAPLAWALAAAARAMGPAMPGVTGLRDQLWAALQAELPALTLTGPPLDAGCLGNLLAIHLPGLPGEPLLNALAADGLYASAGSACHGGRFSDVLRAMGRREPEGAFLRLSLGRLTTQADITAAAPLIGRAARHLRTLTP